MAGRRLPLGFLHIVPGVFPTGVVTYRLRLAAVEWASRPLRQDGSLNRPRHPRRPYPTRLSRRTSRCYSGPAMTPLTQRSAEIKVEWLGDDCPWVSCKLPLVFSPLGWLLTDCVSRPWSGRLAHSDKTAH